MGIITKIEIKTNYISNILQKRHKEKNRRTDRKNIVVYDLDLFEILVELAIKEGTTVSAILNNLYEDFVSKTNSPQKTIESFEQETTIRMPALNASPTAWRLYLKSLSKKEYKSKVDSYLNTLFSLCNERLRQY